MRFRDFFKRPADDTGYPAGKHEAPVYVKYPVMDQELNVSAYVEQLICPVCEHIVKRTDSYCQECGNQLIEEGEQA